MTEMTENERTSHEKFKIEIGPQDILGGKDWVKVTFNKTGQTWIPSLADMHRICEGLAFCEELKYPPSAGFAGGARIYEFLCESYSAWQQGRRFGDLAKRYKIPERTKSGEVVSTNGAKIPTQDASLF